EISSANNARQVAIEVAPGRVGVMILTDGLNWDIGFVRRALLGDSSLSVSTWTREGGGWRSVENGRTASPDAAELRSHAVVVLDAVSPASVGPGFDPALAARPRPGGPRADRHRRWRAADHARAPHRPRAGAADERHRPVALVVGARRRAGRGARPKAVAPDRALARRAGAGRAAARAPRALARRRG